jgi:hypothetical protein
MSNQLARNFVFYTTPACHLFPCLYIARLIWPWRQRRYVPPKCQLIFNIPHSSTSQKIVLFTSSIHLARETGKPYTLQPGQMIPRKYTIQVLPTCECTTKMLKSNIYNCQSPSVWVCLFQMATTEKTDNKRCSCWRDDPRRIVNSPLCVWKSVKATKISPLLSP